MDGILLVILQLNIFDSSKEKNPNLINPGDLVIFKEITKDQFLNYNE